MVGLKSTSEDISPRKGDGGVRIFKSTHLLLHIFHKYSMFYSYSVKRREHSYMCHPFLPRQ